MATSVSVATGNWTTAATWGTITNTAAYVTANTSETINTTPTFEYGATFTAPNTSNAVTHLMASFNISSTNFAVGDVSTVRINLEEDTGGGFAEVAGVDFLMSDIASYPLISLLQWAMVELATPFTFTTTSADAYRIGIRHTRTSGSGSLRISEHNVSGMLLLAIDDRTAAPANTDDVLIVGPINKTRHTVTIDGTRTIGSGGAASGTADGVPIPGIHINHNSKLIVDHTSDVTINIDGNIIIRADGRLECGNKTTPVTAANTVLFDFDTSSATAYFRMYGGGQVLMVGAPQSSTSLWKTTVASGTGVAADPMLTDDAVDWNVGNEISFLPGTNDSTNYNQTEYKFIITKNSSTSYVLSDTSGGAEAAFTFAHANAHALNITRNIIVQGTIGSGNLELIFQTGVSSPSSSFGNPNDTTQFNIQWTRVEKASQLGILTSGLDPTVAVYDIGMSYVVSTNADLQCFWLNGTNPITYTGCIAIKDNGEDIDGFAFTLLAANHTFNDCFAVDLDDFGFEVEGANMRYNRCISAGCNKDGSSTNGPFKLGGCDSIIMTDCESYGSRYSFNVNAFEGNITWINGEFGTRFNDTLNHLGGTIGLALYQFVNCNFGSNVNDPFDFNFAVVPGAVFTYHNHAGTSFNHKFDLFAGTGIPTGAGLGDTTVRTSGSHALRLEPIVRSTMLYKFNVMAFANSAISILGYSKRNSSLTSTITASLFLPNQGAAAATTTLTAGTGWELWSLFSDYTVAVDDLAEIVFEVPYDASGGYLYLDDLQNGSNVLTGFDMWNLGQPAKFMFGQLGNAGEVWSYANAGHAAGTMGEVVDVTSIKADDAGILAILK